MYLCRQKESYCLPICTNFSLPVYYIKISKQVSSLVKHLSLLVGYCALAQLPEKVVDNDTDSGDSLYREWKTCLKKRTPDPCT